MRALPYILVTAFLEGMAVLVVEVAGARALAPFFGASLQVWTAQITATLLFLALGYGLGGRLSQPSRTLTLPSVFWIAGAWLALYPLLRAPILGTAANLLGVAGGSFVSASLLFGPPLLCLGAVSPLLIARLDALQQGAGSAAGRIFFTNTLGGLAGGWLTALVLIPNFSLRLSLAGTGLFLLLLGGLWAWSLRPARAVAVTLPVLAVLLIFLAPSPARGLTIPGQLSVLLWSKHSSVGLVQVVDIGADLRSLLIDGIPQGGMSKAVGVPFYEFSEYQNYIAWRHHPRAQRALVLGLGAGLLARQLHARGLDVTAVELEPDVTRVARSYFGLPPAVRVVEQDARTFLAHNNDKWDLIFLDAYAGETAPWYLVTREALEQIRASLQTDGKLVINLITRQDGSAGLARLEASLLQTFAAARVFVDQPAADDTHDIVVSTLIAGATIDDAALPFPSTVHPRVQPKLPVLLGRGRPAQAGGRLNTDDTSDLDYADASIRAEWRLLAMRSLGAQFLTD